MIQRTSTVAALIGCLSLMFIYLLNQYVLGQKFVNETSPEYAWIVHGFKNILGYLSLLLPGYLIFKYIHKVKYFDSEENGFFRKLFNLCYGEPQLISHSNSNISRLQRTSCEELWMIFYHFLGLQVSYLTWGVVQEKVMTQKYLDSDGGSENFTDSQFLVFVNRVLAFSVSTLYLLYQKEFRNISPLYKYTFCSLSNIMSSWCQYEALKYVSFPHQVLAKSAKTIPVMIMGRIMSKTTYERYEYITSVILSFGMLIFMLDVGNDRATSAVTTFSGALLLILYVIFDSFTSNWQSALFIQYHIKPIQMMCFVNLFSCLFTFTSLLQQGTLLNSIQFMLKHSSFIVDCVLLSTCSVFGQLFIFSTIAKFGPLMFAIITTIRQGFSIFLSCIIYQHQVNAAGVFGILLMFLSIFTRMYCRYRLKTRKSKGVAQTQRT